MDYEPISILKPEVVSRGLSVCRIKSGEIVISAHRDEQRIIFELSSQEFVDFSEKVQKLSTALRTA
jgi:hypothetical protein